MGVAGEDTTAWRLPECPGPEAAPSDSSESQPTGGGQRTVPPSVLVFSSPEPGAGSLPSMRTWLSGATGPGSGSFCSCLLPDCLDLPPKAKCAPCSPLTPQWPSPRTRESLRGSERERTIYSPRRAQERLRELLAAGRAAYPALPALPAHCPFPATHRQPESRHGLPFELTNVGDNLTPHLCSASSCCPIPVRPGPIVLAWLGPRSWASGGEW